MPTIQSRSINKEPNEVAVSLEQERGLRVEGFGQRTKINSNCEVPVQLVTTIMKLMKHSNSENKPMLTIISVVNPLQLRENKTHGVKCT